MIEQDLLRDRDVEKQQIVCNGRLKASYIVDKKWIVEIDENSMLNFRKGDEVHGMARARLATKVAQEHGFKGYIGVSLLEMEYSQNEAAYLLKSLGPIFEEIKQTIKA